MGKLVRNSAKCAHCDVELVSTHRHDFKGHECEAAGKIAQTFDHETATYVPCYPRFWVDGGLEYVRRMFTRKEDYIETSVYE